MWESWQTSGVPSKDVGVETFGRCNNAALFPQRDFETLKGLEDHMLRNMNSFMYKSRLQRQRESCLLSLTCRWPRLSLNGTITDEIVLEFVRDLPYQEKWRKPEVDVFLRIISSLNRCWEVISLTEKRQRPGIYAKGSCLAWMAVFQGRICKTTTPCTKWYTRMEQLCWNTSYLILNSYRIGASIGSNFANSMNNQKEAVASPTTCK